MVIPPTITAVTFDMFQTLVQNNEADWKGTFACICREQRLAVEVEILWQTWRENEGGFRRSRVNLADPTRSPPFRTYYKVWRDAFRDAFGALGVSGDSEAAALCCIRAMSQRPAFPGVMAALRRLRRRGFQLGILSNSDDDSLYPLVSRLDLQMKAVLSSETTRAYKPHPAAFHHILKLLGARPNEVLHVGDSLLDDIHGAKLVGMQAAWINRSDTRSDLSLLPPDVEISCLSQLEEVLT